MNGLDMLKKELEHKNSLQPHVKEVIVAWVNRAYELGLKDAGKIIGEKLSKELSSNINKASEVEDVPK